MRKLWCALKKQAAYIIMVILSIKPHEKSRVFVVYPLLSIPDHMIKEWISSTEQ